MKYALIMFSVIFSFLILLPFKNSKAQTFTVNNPLDFGEVLDMGECTRSRITIFPNGTYTADSIYIFIVEPTRGDVSFTGGPPNTNFTVSFSGNFFINAPGGSRFRINQLTSGPGPGGYVTDAFGNGQFYLGGRSNTRRSGCGSYPDATHTGSYDVTVTFIP